ncbi:acetate--CoA ligase family protein [Pseudonocardia xishanensis]|uniref:Bifunctional GNAT family N-acetyltransferase/acetate--CoA ligase family protein n=1 Tax=Pseudonocardia xishanensis TaxID=630995 RepID=A0ABP8RY59_9PSEU
MTEARVVSLALRPVLAPRSVAVVGASRRTRTVGNLVVRRIVAGGYRGDLTVVGRHGPPEPGLAWVSSVDELPGVDLAVLAVPAAAVLEVAAACGARGVRALLVLSSGVDATALAAVAVRTGMRLVGPNCLGLVSTDPQVALDALFSGPRPPGPQQAGRVGVAAQSGGILLAQLADLDRLGLGTSSAISLGDAPDVGPDDVLTWWADDGRTRAAVLYTEGPHRSAATIDLARRLAPRLPLVAIRAGSSAVGRRAAASHTASTATPRALLDAELRHARIAAVDGPAEATDVLAAFCWCPPATGPRVAVVSNAGGFGVLAADALAAERLEVATPSDATRERLRDVLPPGAALDGPVDTTATARAEAFAAAVEILREDSGTDAVLALGVSTDVVDPLADLRGPTSGVPLLLVRPGQAARVAGSAARAAGPGAPCPVYADASTAARALAHLVRRARRLAAPADSAPDRFEPPLPPLPDTPGWVDPLAVETLLRAAGIPVAPLHRAVDADAAVAARRRIGGAVVLRADVAGLVHRSRACGVAVGLHSDAAVRDAVAAFAARFGDDLGAVLVQPQVPAGPELLVGALREPDGTTLLTVGLGGTATDLVADRAHLLAPGTPDEVDEALDELRAAPRLLTGPDDPARAAVRDAVLRLGALAARLPDLAELEINPLVLHDGSVVAVDARLRTLAGGGPRSS